MGMKQRKFPLIFLVLFLSWGNSKRAAAAPQAPGIKDAGEYDYIVVGAGTAGCVLGGRLAEGNHTVLLIEAGGNPHPDLEIPALTYKYVTDPEYVQSYPLVPQKNTGKLGDGPFVYRSGRLLGGGSSVGAMVFARGNPRDYDNWANITGDDSWNYSNMLKYFKKFENYTSDHPSDQRGFEGPITISRPMYGSLQQWLSAGGELGYPNSEANEPQKLGFTGIDYTQNAGRRVSSYTGYIRPLLQSRPSANQTSKRNLRVLRNSNVHRILFEDGVAIGVGFTKNSSEGLSEEYARARKEIILSAGVIETPMLLMKSGIGPKSILESANLTVLSDLPVGQNFHDHMKMAQSVIFNTTSVVFNRETDLNPEAFEKYLKTGDGPYTSNNGAIGQASFESSLVCNESKSDGLNKTEGWPDFKVAALTMSSQLVLSYNETLPESDLTDGEVMVKFLSVLLRPKSRGNVTLDSADITKLPIIDFQYLSHPDDMQVMIEAIKMSIKICEETETFRQLGCRIPKSPLKQCESFEYRSDEYWNCYVGMIGSSYSQGVGTCRMGKSKDDPEAVVDPELKVIGVKGLRVVDASIMPVITNENIQGAVYAIAERAADMILNPIVKTDA